MLEGGADMDIPKYIGNKIRVYRKREGMDQKQLADTIDVGRSAISNYETGYRTPKQDELFNIANALNVSINDLFPPTIKSEFENSHNIMKIYTQLEEDRQKQVYYYAEDQLEKQSIMSEGSEHYIIRGRATAAGSAIEVDDALARKDVVPNSTVPKGADELVEVTGDSMHPLIEKGDSIYIRYQPTVENGEIAIVRIKDEGVTCKRVYKEGSVIRLRSENDKYDDLVYDSDNITILGKVIL